MRVAGKSFSLAIIAWVFPASLLVFKIIDKTVGMRVSAEEEIAGLDRMEHGTQAYPEFLEQIAPAALLDPIDPFSRGNPTQ